jgi:hypothetical protein
MAQQNDYTQKRFDLIRKRIGQEAESGKQQNQEALQRRFASTGMLGSGAAMKTEQQARTEIDKQRGQAMEGVDVSEMTERGRQAEQAAMMDFAKQERLGSQDFASQQADLMRKFQTGERLSSQKFASAERLGAQGFSKQMQELQQDFQKGLFSEQFEEQKKQFGMQFEEDKRINDFNMQMAKAQFDKPGLMDRLMNPAGFAFDIFKQAPLAKGLSSGSNVVKGWF